MAKARVSQLEVALARVAKAQARTQEQLEQLVRRVDHLNDRVAWLSRDALERRYRERAPSYFHRILRRIRPVPTEELARLAEAAEERGQLALEE